MCAGAVQRQASLAERGYLHHMGGIRARSSKVTLIQVQGLHSTLTRMGASACLLSSVASIPELQPYLGTVPQASLTLASPGAVGAVKPEPGAVSGKALAVSCATCLPC